MLIHGACKSFFLAAYRSTGSAWHFTANVTFLALQERHCGRTTDSSGGISGLPVNRSESRNHGTQSESRRLVTFPYGYSDSKTQGLTVACFLDMSSMRSVFTSRIQIPG